MEAIKTFKKEVNLEQRSEKQRHRGPAGQRCHSGIYRPMVLRVAMAKGLQHADADDLAQDVLSAVGNAIESFSSNVALKKAKIHVLFVKD